VSVLSRSNRTMSGFGFLCDICLKKPRLRGALCYLFFNTSPRLFKASCVGHDLDTKYSIHGYVNDRTNYTKVKSGSPGSQYEI